MNAVGSDEGVDPDSSAILEFGLRAVAVVHQRRETASEMQPLRGKRSCQRSQNICTMHVIVRKAERSLHCTGDRCTEKSPAVIPPTLMERDRLDARLRQCVADAHAVQNARRVRTDLDAGPDLGQRARLLIDVNIDSDLQERQCSGKAPDTRADDRQSDLVSHR